MFSADLFERVVRTAVVAFLIAFLMSLAATITPGVQWSLAWWQSAGLAAANAGLMATGTAVLAVITKQFGASKDTASVLPVKIAGAPLPPPLDAPPAADPSHSAGELPPVIDAVPPAV